MNSSRRCSFDVLVYITVMWVCVEGVGLAQSDISAP